MKRHAILCLAIGIFIAGTCPLVIAADQPLLGMERFDNLKQIGKVIPKRSEDIKASPWGLQFNKHRIPMELMDLFLECIAESGVKWARVETRGFIIARSNVKQKGHYDWAEFDRIVDGLNKRKVEIFITINTDPYSGLDAEDKPMNIESAKDAYESCLKYSGCSLVRDAVDERFIKTIIDNTGRIIDSQNDVGGWDFYTSVSRPNGFDKDRDGMPDTWEKANGLDSSDPSDRNGDIDGDGYTNLEEYLNGVIEIDDPWGKSICEFHRVYNRTAKILKKVRDIIYEIAHFS